MKTRVALMSALFFLSGCSFFKNDAVKAPGNIILIAGTSSAGKSTIINELQKIYGAAYKVISVDNFDFAALKTDEDRAMQLGWNPEKESLGEFMNAYVLTQTGRVVGLPSELRTDAANKICKEASQAQLQAFFKHIKNVVAQGNNVIVDTVFDFADSYDLFFTVLGNQNVFKVLVYCPLQVVARRVEERNKSGKQEEKRTAFQALGQFPAFYKVQDSKVEPVVDVIKSSSTKQLVKKLLDDDAKSMQANLPPVKGAEVVSEINNFYQAFVERFKLDEREEVTLSPMRPYDLIVDSSIDSPAVIAHKIAQAAAK